MTISCTFNPDEDYFVTRYTGHVTDAELYDTYDALLQSPDFVPGMKEIVDLRDELALDVTSTCLKRLADLIKSRHGERISDVTTFIVTHDTIDAIIARLYRFHADSIGGDEVIILTDMDDAVAAHRKRRARN